MQPQNKPKKEVAKWRDLPHKDQLIVLVLARLVEPLVQSSIQAYMFYQLRSFDATLSDATISWQAGVLQASFSAGQTITSWMWGRVADAWGRKAALLLGCLGTLISCLGFGLSQSFVSALVFRTLGGLVNGNIPVLRTMVSEVVKEKKHQARAFLLMPMCFNIGVIIGPVLGGLLANPVETYPTLFGPGSTLGGSNGISWMVRWPYLLPNLLSAAFVAGNMFSICFCLRETKDSAESPLMLSRRVVKRLLSALGLHTGPSREFHYSQIRGSVEDIPLSPDSISSEGSALQKEDAEERVEPAAPPKLPFRRIWTPNVMMTLFAHFATAFHLGIFNSLWFIFLSADRRDTSTNEGQIHGLFTFTGGLNLPPAQVGTAMSVIGVIGITLQVLVYPRSNDKYGVIPLYRVFVLGFPIAYILAPYLAILPSTSPYPGPASGAVVWIGICSVLFFFVVSRTFVLPATMILVNNCCPHPSVLGTVHGVAASVASGARTVGPALAGYLFGVGLQAGVVGLAWWSLALASFVAVFAAMRVREGSGKEVDP